MAQDDLLHAGTAAPAIDAPRAPDWWHNRSSDELQAIARRGEKGGDMFFAAVTEMERRASDADALRRTERRRAREAARRRETIALLAVLFAAVAAVLVLRLTGF